MTEGLVDAGHPSVSFAVSSPRRGAFLFTQFVGEIGAGDGIAAAAVGDDQAQEGIVFACGGLAPLGG